MRAMMTGAISKTALCLAALFALTLVAARLQAPAVSAAAGFSNCTSSCWQGIQPDVTSKTDAVAQLNATFGSQPKRPLCFTTLSGVCDLYEWALPSSPQTTT